MPQLELLGQFFRAERLKMEWTRIDVSRLAGVGVNTIKRLEEGAIKRPHLDTLGRVAAALRISWEDVMPFLTDVPDAMDRIIALAAKVPADKLWIVEQLMRILAEGPPPED